jgi:hypothetical protein
MKFINYLEGISGVSIYPMFSLLVFFIFFVVLIYFVVRMNKTTIQELKSMPFEGEEHNNQTVNSTTINL